MTDFPNVFRFAANGDLTGAIIDAIDSHRGHVADDLATTISEEAIASCHDGRSLPYAFQVELTEEEAQLLRVILKDLGPVHGAAAIDALVSEVGSRS